MQQVIDAPTISAFCFHDHRRLVVPSYVFDSEGFISREYKGKEVRGQVVIDFMPVETMIRVGEIALYCNMGVIILFAVQNLKEHWPVSWRIWIEN